MSLLDNASLVLTPNAYKEGKLYSVIPSDGSGDFTATRATTATRVNADGLVELVPYNLVEYSEQFDNAYWVKSNSSVTANASTAPNGTLTADKLIPNAANNFHSIITPYALNTTFSTVTYSAYLKADGYDFCSLVITSSGGFFNFFEGVFNLSNGTIEATGRAVGGYTGSRSIESVGNGWYRCSITLTNAIQNATHGALITIQSTNNPIAYVGNGTSGILAWGAQFEIGLQTTYQKTETRLNIPRLDYSLGGCPNILLEPQRTNLFTYSEQFDNVAWSKAASTVEANSTTSPSGVINADTHIPNTTNAYHPISQGRAVTSGVSYSFSIYAKAAGYNFLLINTTSGSSSGNVGPLFDLSNGTLVGSLGGNNYNAKITAVGNSWYRIDFSYITNLVTTTIAINPLPTSTIVSYNGDGTSGIFLWGAQLEAGSYATSYIPTTTASVTRNQDLISRNNIYTNGLITAAGGTWFVEVRNNVVHNSGYTQAQTFGLGTGLNGASANNFWLQAINGHRIWIWKQVAGSASVMYVTLTNTAKIAIKWNGSTADVFVNGVKVVAATAFTTTALEELRTFTVTNTYYVNQMALFPTPLTDAQCLALTA